jgi:hypothetical protein
VRLVENGSRHPELSEKVEGSRLVTFRRRLVPERQAEVDGVEWTLWDEQGDLPLPVAAFRVPQEPNEENVTAVFWLSQGLAG